MLKYLFKKSDGAISIVHAVTKDKLEEGLKLEQGSMTQEDYESFIQNKCIPKDVTGYRQIDPSLISADRDFRDAWCDEMPGEQIDIDLEKAKAISLERLREKRNAKLDLKDKEFTKALSTKQDTLEIEAEMQELRDVTEPLKALDCKGKYNDDALLYKIKNLGDKNV